jgi:hypothetical protein
MGHNGGTARLRGHPKDETATSIDISPLRFSQFAEGDLISSSYSYRALA